MNFKVNELTEEVGSLPQSGVTAGDHVGVAAWLDFRTTLMGQAAIKHRFPLSFYCHLSLPKPTLVCP